MRARVRAVALLLAWPALTAQTTGKIPPQALQTQVQKPDVSISVYPETPTANKRAELRAKVSGVAGTLQYLFDVDGIQQKCSPDSSVCEWTPTTPGEYLAHVVVSGRPTASGGRASGGRVGEARIRVKVQPQSTPTPTLTPTLTPTPTPTLTPAPTPPDVPPGKGPNQLAQPEIAVKLLSSRIVAGKSARFSVSLVNAKPFVYAIDMGDGTVGTRTDADFGHTYAEAGEYTIAARFPATGRARAEAPPLRVRVEAAPTDQSLWVYLIPIVVVGVPLLFIAGKLIRRFILRTPTFVPQPDLTPRFDPSRTSGIDLEVVYDPNLASLRYSPRVLIVPEP